MITFTVEFTDGDIQKFNLPNKHGCIDWYSAQGQEMIEYIRDIANSGEFPTKIYDSDGKDYFCDRRVSIFPCPTAKKWGSNPAAPAYTTKL